MRPLVAHARINFCVLLLHRRHACRPQAESRSELYLRFLLTIGTEFAMNIVIPDVAVAEKFVRSVVATCSCWSPSAWRASASSAR